MNEKELIKKIDKKEEELKNLKLKIADYMIQNQNKFDSTETQDDTLKKDIEESELLSLDISDLKKELETLRYENSKGLIAILSKHNIDEATLEKIISLYEVLDKNNIHTKKSLSGIINKYNELKKTQ